MTNAKLIWAIVTPEGQRLGLRLYVQASNGEKLFFVQYGETQQNT